MGYRSKFMLAFRGPGRKIKKLKAWIDEKIEIGPSDLIHGKFYSRKSTYEALKESESMCSNLDNLTEGCELLYEHDYMKCYPPWDDVIDEILLYARDDLGIEAAYARIGEMYEDFIMDEDPDLYIDFVRTLSSPF
jgi:hypothetical protein